MSKMTLQTALTHAATRTCRQAPGGPRTPISRGVALTVGLLGGIGLMAATVGCATGSPPPEVVEARYAGPAMSLEESGGQWIALVRPDSPGWRVTLDRRAEGYGFEGVYVTIQEPNPAFSYPLVPVEQRLALNVDARRPVKVFARLLSFDGESASGESYVPTPAASGPR